MWIFVALLVAIAILGVVFFLDGGEGGNWPPAQ